jgi:hypothetical protein
MVCNFTYYNITTGQEHVPYDNPVLYRNIDRMDKEYIILCIKLVMKINGWNEDDEIRIYSNCCCSSSNNPYMYKNGTFYDRPMEGAF